MTLSPCTRKDWFMCLFDKIHQHRHSTEKKAHQPYIRSCRYSVRAEHYILYTYDLRPSRRPPFLPRREISCVRVMFS